jgi:hypothetical protein
MPGHTRFVPVRLHLSDRALSQEFSETHNPWIRARNLVAERVVEASDGHRSTLDTLGEVTIED